MVRQGTWLAASECSYNAQKDKRFRVWRSKAVRLVKVRGGSFLSHQPFAYLHVDVLALLKFFGYLVQEGNSGTTAFS